MKFMLDTDYKPLSPDPLRVRLVDETLNSQRGITMQVLVIGKWHPVCTLRNEGSLGLWDVQNQDLAGVGFDMRGYHVDHGTRGHISTHIQ